MSFAPALRPERSSLPYQNPSRNRRRESKIKPVSHPDGILAMHNSNLTEPLFT
jgi:hypothetical protein